MTKTEKLLTLLQTGQNLTAKEISRATKLSNPGEAIRQLRNQGYCIYTNKNGYRLGKPTKAMVQYVALHAGNTVFDAR
jgi:biotin operon repressor